jgi:methylenetetrahydrofolate dehydrogenase (NADP+)/methenyltetrahydrofolate cyclohydrolase
MILYTDKYVSDKIATLKQQVNEMERPPKLIIIRVDGDPASEKYVKNKEKRCKEVGIVSETILFPKDISQEIVANRIEELNNNKNVDAILLQLPLPDHLDEHFLTNQICPYKDVDGFTIWNTGLLSLGEPGNVACTPRGIIDFLKYNNIELEGADVCIVNRSNILGKPLANLLLLEGATPTICHSKTKNLKFKMLEADIVVLGTGQPDFVDIDSFTAGQIVVDVSINFNSEGKMCGDIKKSDYQALADQCVSFTPVPGGVGQLTVLALIEQTIEIAKKRIGGAYESK